MTRSLVALVSRARVPLLPALKQAIGGLGFGMLSVDAGYAPFGPAGYLPCTLDGEDAGFDIRFDEAPALPGDDRDVCLTLRWSGDPREQASALIVCAALAQDCGAVVHAPGDLKILTASDLAARVRETLAVL